jgi:ribosomal protein L37AE/L43A
MTKDAARISGPDNTGERVREPARSSRLLRARTRSVLQSDAGGWSCPECGLPTHDLVATRLGFCARCHEFTGMCAAGRKIICSDVMSMTTWYTPCTNLGASAWQIAQGAISRVALLCPQHDAEVRAGRTSWLSEAIPLTPAAPYDAGPPPTECSRRGRIGAYLHQLDRSVGPLLNALRQRGAVTPGTVMRERE